MHFGEWLKKISTFFRSHRKNLIAQMIFSYVVLQMLCVFLFLIPATDATHAMQEQARERAVDRALTISDQADATFVFFRNTGVSLLSEESISDLAHMKEMDINGQYLAILSTIRSVNSIYGSAFDQIYLAFRNQNALLGVAGKLDREALYETMPFNTLSIDQYEALFSEKYQSPQLLIANDGMIYYCYTLPFRYMQDQSINLVFSLSMRTLFTKAQTEDIAEVYGIHLEDGTVQLSTAISSKLQDEIEQLAADAGGIAGTFQLSTGQTLCVVASDFPGCSYLYIDSLDNYTRTMSNHVQYLWLAMLFFFVISSALIALFVAGQYRPIKVLLSELDTPDMEELRYDEYRQIFNRLAQLREQHDRDRNVLVENRTGLVHFLYRRLLSGDPVASEEWFTFERLYGPEILEGNFCVIAISAARGRPFPDNVTEYMLETHPLVYGTLTDILGGSCQIELLEYHGLLCCILNARMPISTMVLQEKLETVSRIFRENGRFYCDFYVGEFHEGAESLSKSLCEAMECVGRNTSFGTGAILFYAETQDSSQQTQGYRGVYPIDCENKLLARLKTSDESGVLEIINGLFLKVYGSKCDSALMLHSLCQNLLCTFLRSLDGLPLNSEDEDGLEDRLSKCFVSDFRPFPEIAVRELFCDLALDVMKRVSAEKGRGALQLYQQITDYVAENLADVNLSVASIAEHFSYSVSALSGYFSNAANEGLHNYINRMRVEAAIHLMKKWPKMTLAEISCAAGFTNLRTFTRVFSTETGISPGKYRKTIIVGERQDN